MCGMSMQWFNNEKVFKLSTVALKDAQMVCLHVSAQTPRGLTCLTDYMDLGEFDTKTALDRLLIEVPLKSHAKIVRWTVDRGGVIMQNPTSVNTKLVPLFGEY